MTNATDVNGFKKSTPITLQAWMDEVVKQTEGKINFFSKLTFAQIAAIQAGTSTEDLSSYANAACSEATAVYFPKGKYHLNIELGNKCILMGEGSRSTRFFPFDYSKAIVRYKAEALNSPRQGYFDYAASAHWIGFTGSDVDLGNPDVVPAGIGFAYAKNDTTSFVAGDEQVGGFNFYQCYFEKLDKAFYKPFGNIGTDFYSCGFRANNIVAYMRDNMEGGELMHCGNVYFHGGEANHNNIVFYGWGTPMGIVTNDMVIENNHSVAYFYFDDTSEVLPVVFNDQWGEFNGAPEHDTSVTHVTIDTWTYPGYTPVKHQSGLSMTSTSQAVKKHGMAFIPKASALPFTTSDWTTDAAKFDILLPTKGTKSIPKHSIYTEGSGGTIVQNRGFFTDAHIDSTNTQVKVNDSRCERLQGYGGAEYYVAQGSSIILRSPRTGGGIPRAEGVVVEGYMDFPAPTIAANPSDAQARWWRTPARTSKVREFGTKVKASATFADKAHSLSGSFSLAGQIVNDGATYSQCGSYYRSLFGSSELANADGTTFTTTAGKWYAFTLDMKVVSGDVQAHVWDRNVSHLALYMQCPTVGKWSTFAGYGYSPSAQTMYLDFQGLGVAADWRAGAFQVVEFDTKEEAQAFLAGGAYAEKDNANTLLLTNATPTAILTPPSSVKLATYLVTASLGNGAPGAYTATGIVTIDAGVPSLTELKSATNLFLWSDGPSVYVSHTNGGTVNVHVTIQRLGPQIV